MFTNHLSSQIHKRNKCTVVNWKFLKFIFLSSNCSVISKCWWRQRFLNLKKKSHSLFGITVKKASSTTQSMILGSNLKFSGCDSLWIFSMVIKSRDYNPSLITNFFCDKHSVASFSNQAHEIKLQNCWPSSPRLYHWSPVL